MRLAALGTMRKITHVPEQSPVGVGGWVVVAGGPWGVQKYAPGNRSEIPHPNLGRRIIGRRRGF